MVKKITKSNAATPTEEHDKSKPNYAKFFQDNIIPRKEIRPLLCVLAIIFIMTDRMVYGSNAERVAHGLNFFFLCVLLYDLKDLGIHPTKKDNNSENVTTTHANFPSNADSEKLLNELKQIHSPQKSV
jgi:hypothetical protein